MGDYFIRIDDAPDLRRKILESSKASIHVLRGYQQLLKTRGEKQTMLRALRREMKEITLLVNRMEELIPSLTKTELQRMNGEPTRAAPRAAKPMKRPSLPRLPEEKRVFIGKATPRLLPVKKAEKEVPAAPEPAPVKRALSLQEKLATIEEKLKRI